MDLWIYGFAPAGDGNQHLQDTLCSFSHINRFQMGKTISRHTSCISWLAWLLDWLVCVDPFFSSENNWFISFLSWLIVCTFQQNIFHIAMDCYQLQLGHELLVDQLNRHLLKPNTGCESQDHLGLENFSQVFQIWQLKITTHPSHVHGRSKPWHLQDFVVERHVRLRNQHLELISVQAKLEKLLSTSHFSRQMLLAYFSFYQNRFCQTLSKELLFSAKFPFRKSCQKHQTLLFQRLKLLHLIPISLSLKKAI